MPSQFRHKNPAAPFFKRDGRQKRPDVLRRGAGRLSKTVELFGRRIGVRLARIELVGVPITAGAAAAHPASTVMPMVALVHTGGLVAPRAVRAGIPAGRTAPAVGRRTGRRRTGTAIVRRSGGLSGCAGGRRGGSRPILSEGRDAGEQRRGGKYSNTLGHGLDL